MARMYVTKPYWYIAVQDGWFDRRRFNSPEQAEQARMALDEQTRKGTCVMAGSTYEELEQTP